MRVLALHGYRTNAAILRMQLKPLAEKLGPEWNFTCINAPHSAKGEPDESVKVAFPAEKDYYEWFDYKRNDDGTYAYENFEASVTYVREIVLAEQYDILLGFSQVS